MSIVNTLSSKAFVFSPINSTHPFFSFFFSPHVQIVFFFSFNVTCTCKRSCALPRKPGAFCVAKCGASPSAWRLPLPFPPLRPPCRPSPHQHGMLAAVGGQSLGSPHSTSERARGGGRRTHMHTHSRPGHSPGHLHVPAPSGVYRPSPSFPLSRTGAAAGESGPRTHSNKETRISLRVHVPASTRMHVCT